MANFSVKHAGAWKQPTAIHVRHANVWKAPVGAFVKSGGVWQQYWPVGPASSMVTSYTPGALQNNHTGEKGLLFMFPVAQTMTWMGCRIATGNTGTHTVKLYEYVSDTLQRTGTFDMSNPVVRNGFAWVPITSFTLLANTPYLLMKTVTSGGQFWWDEGPTVVPNSSMLASAERFTGSPSGGVTTGMQFVGLNLGW